MRSTSVVNIDLSALDRNVSVIRDLISPQCELCGIVKADAYGLGAGRIARQLAESGVGMLAVYNLAQAEAISAAGVTTPQLVLMPVREIESGGAIHRLLLAGRLHLVVHGLSHAIDLALLADRLGGGAIPVHVEIDTGMSRGGSVASEAARTLAQIADDRRLRLAGVFTHFSASRECDATTHAQMDAFESILESQAASISSEVLIHAANSHALLRHPRFHRQMVRAGLAWTGLAELPEVAHDDPVQLESIVSWESAIVHVKQVPCDASVGYGSLFRTKRATRLGIVPVGYFDGYPLTAPGTERWVRLTTETPHGMRSCEAPVVGAVNMDQIIVDLSDTPASLAYGDGYIGMTAEIYGRDRAARNYLPRIANACATHPYELLCRLNPRIPRNYVGEAVMAKSASALRLDLQTPGAMTG
ncbi:MAG: alanine racemase [Phycisphaerales bacterium]|nr:alanine racemase [Phycisphaerales bacterium]